MKKICKNQRASTTLEAVIIMPTILIAIFAVFFAFQIMYQYVLLEYAVSYGASRGAMMWEYNENDWNSENLTKRGMYDSFNTAFNNSNVNERVQTIENKTNDIINSLAIVKSNGTLVNCNYTNSFLGQKLEVTAEQKVAIPFDAFIKYFGGTEMKIRAKSTASLFDPDEYIRNIDYGLELAGQLKDGIGKIIENINK